MSKNRRKHSPDLVNAALASIRGKRLSIRKASKMFGIPLTTLHNKLTGRRPIEPFANTLLTTEEEDKIAEWIAESTERGFGKTRDEVRLIAKYILDRRNASSKSKTHKPTSSWLYNFCKRHPELTLRSPKSLGKERSLEKWFRDYKSCIDSIDPMLLNDATRIYNVVEIGFTFDANSREVNECNGLASVCNVKTDVKPQVTLLACTSAGGHFLSPLFIYPYKKMPPKSHLEDFPEAALKVSDDGLKTAQIFNSWLRDIFIPATANTQKPVVLLVQGHSTNTTLVDTPRLCHDNQIVLHDLLRNSSHLIQSLGQEFIDAVKPAWSDARKQHICEHGGGVDLESFAKVLKPVWSNVTTQSIAAQSFKAAGIVPFDPDRVIQSSKLGLSAMFLPETLGVQNVVQLSDSNYIPSNMQPTVENIQTSLNDAKNIVNDILSDAEINPISSDIIPKCEINPFDDEILPIMEAQPTLGEIQLNMEMKPTLSEVQPITEIQSTFHEEKPIMEMQPTFTEIQLDMDTKPIVDEFQPILEIDSTFNEFQPAIDTINKIPSIFNIPSHHTVNNTPHSSTNDLSHPSSSSPSLVAPSNPDLPAAQLKALQEYSYFLYDEMGRNQFTNFFGKLTGTVEKKLNRDEEEKFNVFKKLAARLIEPCAVVEEEPKHVQVKANLAVYDFHKPISLVGNTLNTLVGKAKNKQRAVHIQTSPNLVGMEKLREALIKKSADREEIENNKLKKIMQMEEDRKENEEKREALKRKEGKQKKGKKLKKKEEQNNRLKRNGQRKAKKVILVNSDSIEDSDFLQTMELEMVVEDGDN